ncbi:MAG: hypothetical protein AB7L90_17490 [Hyphomicrobiaceae bacterium]|uniref:hypothetical protein n=1 Tax=Pseudorhodoplanes sp. TaxID=1934341 RepID=UPI003D11B7EA
MANSKTARLQRLVRVTELIYRRESAELARLHLEVRAATDGTADAERRLDDPLAGGDFIFQLSMARAARARRNQAGAELQFHSQLDVTMNAMGQKKGAEGGLKSHSLAIRNALSRRDDDEILERLVSLLRPA